MAGYSGTPLPRKLGVKPGQRLAWIGAPDGFPALLGPLPEGAALAEGEEPVDLAVLFARSEDELRRLFPAVERRVTTDGALWVAWSKRASGVPTDLTEDRVRAVGLAGGRVDVKVCAIDGTWSGLKLVVRVADRPGRRVDAPPPAG